MVAQQTLTLFVKVRVLTPQLVYTPQHFYIRPSTFIYAPALFSDRLLAMLAVVSCWRQCHVGGSAMLAAVSCHLRVHMRKLLWMNYNSVLRRCRLF